MEELSKRFYYAHYFKQSPGYTEKDLGEIRNVAKLIDASLPPIFLLRSEQNYDNELNKGDSFVVVRDRWLYDLLKKATTAQKEYEVLNTYLQDEYVQNAFEFWQRWKKELKMEGKKGATLLLSFFLANVMTASARVYPPYRPLPDSDPTLVTQPLIDLGTTLYDNSNAVQKFFLDMYQKSPSMNDIAKSVACDGSIEACVALADAEKKELEKIFAIIKNQSNYINTVVTPIRYFNGYTIRMYQVILPGAFPLICYTKYDNDTELIIKCEQDMYDVNYKGLVEYHESKSVPVELFQIIYDSVSPKKVTENIFEQYRYPIWWNEAPEITVSGGLISMENVFKNALKLGKFLGDIFMYEYFLGNYKSNNRREINATALDDTRPSLKGKDTFPIVDYFEDVHNPLPRLTNIQNELNNLSVPFQYWVFNSGLPYVVVWGLRRVYKRIYPYPNSGFPFPKKDTVKTPEERALRLKTIQHFIGYLFNVVPIGKLREVHVANLYEYDELQPENPKKWRTIFLLAYGISQKDYHYTLAEIGYVYGLYQLNETGDPFESQQRATTTYKEISLVTTMFDGYASIVKKRIVVIAELANKIYAEAGMFHKFPQQALSTANKEYLLSLATVTIT
jgi:hypothetical protein